MSLWRWVWLLLPGALSIDTHPQVLAGEALLFGALALTRRSQTVLRFDVETFARHMLLTLVVPSSAAALLTRLFGPLGEPGFGAGLQMMLCSELHAAVLATEWPTTASQWLTRPASIRALVLQRWALAAGVSALAVFQLRWLDATTTQPIGLTGLFWCAAGGVAPAIALVVKDLTLTTIASVAMGVLAMRISSPTLSLGASTAIALAAVQAARQLTLVTLPNVGATRWFSVATGPRGRVLLSKELRLHWAAYVMSAATVLLWATGDDTSIEPLTLFGGAMTAALAGVGAVQTELRYGTLLSEQAQWATGELWRTKTTVALGIALLGGVALPVPLLWARDHGPTLLGLVEWAMMISIVAIAGLSAGAQRREMPSALAQVALTLFSVGAVVAGTRLATNWGLHRVLGSAAHAPPHTVRTASLVGLCAVIVWVLSRDARRQWLQRAVVASRSLKIIGVAACVSAVFEAFAGWLGSR